jgi:hypothetical protein
MKPYYSIVQALIRPSIGEYISIGLVFGISGEKPFFKLSGDKIKAGKSLLPHNARPLFSLSIQDLLARYQAEDFETLYTPIGTRIEKPSSFPTISFLNYLSRYQNNLIRFSEPKEIDFDFSSETFCKLFEAYVAGEESTDEDIIADMNQEVQSGSFVKLRTTFYPRIANRVNQDYKITHSFLSTLPKPQTVNFIGRNDAIVLGQEIDFSGLPGQVGRQTTDLYALIKAFEYSKETNGSYFVIGQEPSRVDRKRWELWETIKKSNQIQFVDIDETERIVDYIFQHDVQPVIQE